MAYENMKLICDLPRLPARDVQAHKGSFGHALLVGGAPGMTGAISLAGMACLRSGSGLVSLAVPVASLQVVASLNPNYMTIPLECDLQGNLILACISRLDAAMARATCVAIGPGLGRSQESDEIVLNLLKKATVPMVVDADALNALSSDPDWKDTLKTASQYSQSDNGSVTPQRVLTPHPGEWQRLAGVSARDRSAQIDAANELARATCSTVVLKGHRTWVTDGHSAYENSTGNPSMATGGSGDCLTGMIAALICQGMSCFDAAVLGVYLHGLSADLAHEALGTPSTLATDLIDFLPGAFRHFAQTVI